MPFLVAGDVMMRILSHFIPPADLIRTRRVNKRWRLCSDECIQLVESRRAKLADNVLEIARSEGEGFRHVPVMFRKELAANYSVAASWMMHEAGCECDAASFLSVGCLVDAPDYLSTWGMAEVIDLRRFEPRCRMPMLTPTVESRLDMQEVGNVIDDGAAADDCSMPRPFSLGTIPMRRSSSTDMTLHALVRFLGWGNKWSEWIPAHRLRCCGSVVSDPEFRGKRWGWRRAGSNSVVAICNGSTPNELPAGSLVVTDVTMYLMDPNVSSTARMLRASRVI